MKCYFCGKDCLSDSDAVLSINCKTLIQSELFRILSPEEQKLQDTIDNLSNEIYSQLWIPKCKEESATEMAIIAYDDFMQKEFKGGKVNKK